MEKPLIAEGKSLLVIGSQNENPDDRVLDRSEIRSVQVLDRTMGLREARFFSSWGECGVSSVAADPVSPQVLYVATSTTIVRVDADGGDIVDLEIPDLIDIHEITMAGTTLRIANTGRDEIVCYDTRAGSVSDRLSLRKFARRNTPMLDATETAVDTFHCNQWFEDQDGDPFVLVHHTEGRQILKRIAQRLLKSHGTGGIINTDTGEVASLNLKAPHSVRICGSHYTILNSGHFLLQIYDSHWNLIKRIDTSGFGRGADFDASIGMYYGGVSATRKRYLDVSQRNSTPANTVLFVSFPEFSVVHRQDIPGIEQINNIYLVDALLANRLVELAERLPVTQVA